MCQEANPKPAYRGQYGAQCNFTVEYFAAQAANEKNKSLGRVFEILMFDKEALYRPEWETLGLSESDRGCSEEDSTFVNEDFIGKIEMAANQRIQEVVEGRIKELQGKYPNAVLKRTLENICFFIFK